MLCGFTFAGFTAISEFKGEMIYLNMSYLVATASSLGFGLLSVTTASFCLLMGPGKALRSSSIKGLEDAISTLKDKS